MQAPRALPLCAGLLIGIFLAQSFFASRSKSAVFDEPTDIAAGRMFCIQLPGGGENIIWTENYGHLLVVAKGAVSHEQVWLWFVAVHHNVAFKGAPAMPGM